MQPAPDAGIAANGLGLATSRGWVYRDVDLIVPAGSLAVVTGPAGCGKTALLLTLAARMRPTAGALWVGDCDAVAHPQRARRLVGLGETAGVNELDQTLTVGDQVSGELALHSAARRCRPLAGTAGRRRAIAHGATATATSPACSPRSVSTSTPGPGSATCRPPSACCSASRWPASAGRRSWSSTTFMKTSRPPTTRSS